MSDFFFFLSVKGFALRRIKEVVLCCVYGFSVITISSGENPDGCLQRGRFWLECMLNEV